MVSYITRVEACASMHMRQLHIFAPVHKARARSWLPFYDIPLKGLASLEVTSELREGQTIYTARLAATLCGLWSVPRQPVALRLTYTDGRRVIIGTDAAPYPTVAVTVTRPDSAASKSALTLSATWTAALPPLELIE